jgi:PAS domain S-box-containing protein
VTKPDESPRTQNFTRWIENFGEKVRSLRDESPKNAGRASPSEADPLYRLQAAQEELHAAEEELRMQNDQLREAFELADVERRRYRDLFEFADDGYILTDARGVITEANRVAGKLLNIAPQFLISKPLIRMISADQHDLFRAELRQLQQTGKTSEMTVRIEPRASASFFAALKASAITDETGSLSGMRWLLRDVAEQVIMQTRLRTLNEEAQQEMRTQALRLEDACRQRDEALQQERALRAKAEAREKSKEHAVAAFQHELRTRTSAMRASVLLLEQDPALPAPAREALETIRRNADILDRLSGDLGADLTLASTPPQI